ncbi:MAG: 5'/3'-nucleotidase SurE [Candidatus Omnitrophica bacterium]|nr:5'/3'-nucleotidase SurE [Candidatus Omnitrophota bacterium]
MMNILITNDDGVHALGIRKLVESLPEWAKVMIVGPATEKSASSHSITIKDKLKVEALHHLGKPCYAVHGTPADSVKFAFSNFLDFTPELVISGINQGTNTGVSVYYSGTISAAREAFINGVPSIAVSLASKTHRDFSTCCKMTNLILEAYAKKHMPLDMMLSVNVPPLSWEELKGIKITKQAASRFVEEFIHEGDHEGKRVFSLAGEMELASPDGESDEEAVGQGFISITPLKLDLTHYEVMPILNQWKNRICQNPI